MGFKDRTFFLQFEWLLDHCRLFQFKRPSAEDFVEVEDEESDMMVIKTKTIVLEDELKEAKKVKETLQKVQKILSEKACKGYRYSKYCQPKLTKGTEKYCQPKLANLLDLVGENVVTENGLWLS